MHSHSVRVALVASATFFGTLLFASHNEAHARNGGRTVTVPVTAQVEQAPRPETDDGPGVSESALAILPIEDGAQR
jgi:hypothetical protein